MRARFAMMMVAFVTLPAYAHAGVVSGSYYHPKFEGRSMACGGRFDNDGLTAASNHHPCGTQVRVSYQDRDVVVRVTDRCGRCGIDLTQAAARELGLLSVGRAPVRVEPLTSDGSPQAGSSSGREAPVSSQPVKSVWTARAAPSDDGFVAPTLTGRTVMPARVGHVGAVPTAPVPSFWIMRE